VINKYKKLAPKGTILNDVYNFVLSLAFKLMDMTLQEIFSSLFIIEQDASKVWAALTASYP